VWSGGAANGGGKPVFQPALVDLPQKAASKGRLPPKLAAPQLP
jgi:hypothetical protein